MKILFLTIVKIDEIETSSLFKDLLRKFIENGHDMYVVTPAERRFKIKTCLVERAHIHILKVKTLNIKQCSIVEKGLSTILIEGQYYRAVKKYFGNVKFDLILYSTPPITFNKVVSKIKKRYHAKSYLMLKDIFPQNAVDLGMFSEKSIFYQYFRRKEKKLYRLSDYIGCMSPANVKFLLSHNKYLNPQQVEICPNSIDVKANKVYSDKIAIRKEYNIPLDATLFVYGGNLGKPQGIDFLLDVLKSNIYNDKAYFLIVGSGTEYGKIKVWLTSSGAKNVQLLAFVPKEKYNYLISAGDVGLIFLDRRFTIPNFPTRLLGYLLHKMPVLLATDVNTDVGRLVQDNGCGFWVESGELVDFNRKVQYFISNPDKIGIMGEKGYKFLLDGYEVSRTYQVIASHF